MTHYMPRILLKCTLWHSYLQKAFTHKYRGREKNDILEVTLVIVRE